MPDENLTDGPGLTADEVRSYDTDTAGPYNWHDKSTWDGIWGLLRQMEQEGLITEWRADPDGGVLRFGGTVEGEFHDLPTGEAFGPRAQEIIIEKFAVDAEDSAPEGRSWNDWIGADEGEVDEVFVPDDMADDVREAVPEGVDVIETGPDYAWMLGLVAVAALGYAIYQSKT